jgi:hypothetical protein
LNNATITTKGLINGASTPTVATLFKKGIGGLPVIASPYNWLEHFTPRKQWLNVRTHAGAPRTSLEGIGDKLSKHFIVIGEPKEVEFVVRETARTFHHNISQVTLWRRIC